MKKLQSDTRSDTQIWGNNQLHIMNISDEIVTGMEGISNTQVGGVSTAMYKLRPQATLNKENAFIVPEQYLQLSRELSDYHREIGVNDLPRTRILGIGNSEGARFSEEVLQGGDRMRDFLKESSISGLSAFIESSTIQKTRKVFGLQAPVTVDIETVNAVNNKGIFLEAMSKIGVPTAYGKTLYTKDTIWNFFKELRQMGAKTVYAKLGRAASGQGVFPINCNTNSEMEEFLNLPQTNLQINTIGIRIDFGIEDIIDSPNVMILVGEDPDKDRFISASSQILAKRNPHDEKPTVHKGNISGLDPKIQERCCQYAQNIANWMRSIGAFGIVGLDFIVTKNKDIYIMEANYRVNGGLAAAMKGHDLGSKFWAASSAIQVPRGTDLNTYIQFLQRNGLEYKGKEGIIILNPATSPAGVMQVGIYGENQKRILDILEGANMR